VQYHDDVARQMVEEYIAEYGWKQTGARKTTRQAAKGRKTTRPATGTKAKSRKTTTRKTASKPAKRVVRKKK
jgi:hypothetical protein